MRRIRLRTRIALIFLALMLAVQLAGFAVTRSSIDAYARQAVDAQLEVGVRVFERLLAQNADNLLQSARILAADYGFRESVASDDRQTIESALANHGERIGASVAMFWGTDRDLRASTALPAGPEALAHLARLVADAQGTGSAHGAVLFDEHLHQVVVVAVRAPITIGWVVLGFSADRALATDLGALSGLHVTMLAQVAARDAAPILMLSSTLPDEQARRLAERARGAVRASPRPAIADDGETGFGAIAVPIAVQPGGAAHALLLRGIDEARAPYAPLQATLLLLTAAGLVVSAIGALLTARRISEPLALLATAADRLGAGDATVPLPDMADDELERLARAFGTMRERLAEREARIARLAYYDALTGLPNRLRLEQLADGAMRDACDGALLLADLVRFKHVNDVLGHSTGDRALAAVAQRLAPWAQAEGASLARTESDEFALLAPGRDGAHAQQLAEALGVLLQAPLEVDGQAIDVGVSVGIATWSSDDPSASALIARAEIAMYEAKRRRVATLAYDPAFDDDSAESLTLAGELRRAIAESEFELHFQPKMRLADGTLAGCEALVRWRHPQRGMVPPDRFLPFAEQTGAIRGITRWVVGRAVAQLAAWRDAGLDVPIAVNLSTRDLMDSSLVDVVARALAEHRVTPASLTLEITESAIMDDAERALQVLDALQALGTRLSIDDFGTGYSSLAYLKRLPVHELKIDRSFVRDMAGDRDDATIVGSTIDLGHRMGLKVVAEGVEDERTERALRDAGCDLAQGFRFARPMPARAFEEFARARARQVVAVDDAD